MRELEELFFERLSAVDIDELPLVFILGSPRTGSTLIYQILINFFDFCYFSNLVNDNFAKFPVIGIALTTHLDSAMTMRYESEFGKTQGYSGPSEGSFIFRNWFGGEHPSQTCSCSVLPGQKNHLVQSMKCIYRITGRPILTKNAWNCFRIGSLTELFPNIHFVWIRRDICTSAYSDLKARYIKGGSPTSWNSATTANYKEIQKRPYWEQVAEQQYEYNRSIAHDLDRFCPEQYFELWYEDICKETEQQIEHIRGFFEDRSLFVKDKDCSIPDLRILKSLEIDDDYHKIANYIFDNNDRFYSYSYVSKFC